MSDQTPQTPQQQPTPTGTTPPGKRKMVAVAFIVLIVILIYNWIKPASQNPRHGSTKDDQQGVASEEQIEAAKQAAKWEAEQERMKKEREEALQKARAQPNAITNTAQAHQPIVRSGGGGGERGNKRSAPSIVFDLAREQQGLTAAAPIVPAAYAIPGDERQQRAFELARQIAAANSANQQGVLAAGQQAMAARNQMAVMIPNYGVPPNTLTGQSNTLATSNPPLVNGIDGPAHQHLLNPNPAWPKTVLPEDTVIEGVLKNRLEGANDGPIEVMVTTNVYQPGTHRLVFPQGTDILGETKRVALLNQERLAALFHRALVQLPDGSEYGVPLDAPALDQEGAVALHDKVDHHYLQIFGASLAVGAIGGLANIGNSYGGAAGYDTLSTIRSGIGAEMGMSAQQIMTFYLNRLPTIVIREGTRVKIMLTGDLSVPLYPDEGDQ